MEFVVHFARGEEHGARASIAFVLGDVSSFSLNSLTLEAARLLLHCERQH